MKIKLKLYGTLGRGVPSYDPEKGMEIEMPTGSTVADVIGHLAIPRKKVGIVSVDGHLARESTPLRNGNLVSVFKPIFGG